MGSFRELDGSLIVGEAAKISKRVEERFPGSGLAGLARELVALGDAQSEGLLRLRNPNWPIRILSVAATIAMLAILALALGSLDLATGVEGAVDLAQGIESAINDVIFIAIAIYFLFTLEQRLKRRVALAALHQLRSIAHIVDMHQLTKDPEQVLSPEMPKTPSSPVRTMTRFELSRYLDYCSEMLAITGKLASLYAQVLSDPVVLATVNDVESLTIGLSRKIWQKIMILDDLALRERDGPDGG